MNILIEGPDGAGKSTLANALAEAATNATLLHSGPLVGSPFVEYEQRLQPHLQRGGNNVIIADRWYLGELVYGPVFRGASQLDGIGRWHIEQFLEARGTLQIILLPPVDVLVERVGVRGDDMVKTDQLADLYARYTATFDELTLTTILIDAEDPVDYVNEITMMATAAALKSKHTELFKSYVGPQQPDYLLIGHRAAQHQLGCDGVYAPLPSSPGRFLLEHMLPAVVDKTFGMADASENIEALWHALDMPEVVCLGDVAHDKLALIGADELGFGWGSVPDPGQVQRFARVGQAGYHYARTIIAALDNEEDMRSWRP